MRLICGGKGGGGEGDLAGDFSPFGDYTHSCNGHLEGSRCLVVTEKEKKKGEEKARREEEKASAAGNLGTLATRGRR